MPIEPVIEPEMVASAPASFSIEHHLQHQLGLIAMTPNVPMSQCPDIVISVASL
ncbi:hypothetical protein [Proteus sp. TSJ240517]|uniref:hypothetical protein n=1 Tax=Proteus sp. TSJ240517 TaxID=3399622 RepID=UPI003A4E2A25